MNYIYEDREPRVGDLVLWTGIKNPKATGRTLNKPYMVVEYSGKLVTIINDEGDRVELGCVKLKLLKTKPVSEAKIGDIMYRIRNGETGDFPPGSTKPITEINKELKILNYSQHYAVQFEDTIILEQNQGQTMQQQFTKADLKTGMMVETEELEYGLILGNAILWCTRGKGGTPLRSIENALYSDTYPIVKVYAERKDASGSDLIYKAKNPSCLLGNLIYEVPVQKNQVEVSNAGDSNRTIYINRETPDLIHIGCFTGTFKEAVAKILDRYGECLESAQYIAKVSECFKLAEKEFKD